MYYISQMTSNDCLFTAFKILLANVKDDERYLYLKEDENHGHYSFFEIIEKGKQYGLDMFGFESEEKAELKNCKTVPLILNLKKGESVLHSVYVYKITKHFVYYLDSDEGKFATPINKFIEMWDGKGLMIRKNTIVEFKDDFTPIKIKKSFLPIAFQIISAISFVFGIYFMDSQNEIILPLCLILLGMLAEGFSKILQIISMKEFDKASAKILIHINKNDYYEFLLRREKLKLNIFDPKNNLLVYLLSCSFAIFIILLNNPLNFICVLIPILCGCFQCFVVEKIEKKMMTEVGEMEVNFYSHCENQNAEKQLTQIENKSYRFAYWKLLKSSVGIFLFFLASLITLLAFGTFNLINSFFLVFTEVFLYQNLIPLLSNDIRRNEQKLNYMKFINLVQ